MTAQDGVEVVFAVSNVGAVAGAETVQLYVRDDKSRLQRPEKELAAFEKVFLEAGETVHLRVLLDKYAVGYYDTAVPGWIAEEGTFQVLIGASSADIRYVVFPPFPPCLDIPRPNPSIFWATMRARADDSFFLLQSDTRLLSRSRSLSPGFSSLHGTASP